MGNLMRSQINLIAVTAGITSTLIGPSYLLKPAADNVPDYRHVFAVVFQSTGSAMSATPNITPSLETSWDNTNWVSVATGTAIVADGSLTEQKAVAGNLGPYVRAVSTIGGTATYTGTVKLIANAHFTVAAA